MTDRDLQIYELEALESVLREKKLAKSSDWSDKNAEIQGIIEVGFDNLYDPTVTIEGTSDSGDQFHLPLDILPPIRLKFHLPNDYPTVSSPKLELESYWMNQEQMTSCETELAKICEENQMMEVLFMCYQTIIDLMAQNTPKIINLNEACALNRQGETIESLKMKILQKEEEAVEEQFVNTLYDCQVCFESQMGQHCIKFQPCSHVFCKSCTFNYYISIAKGFVSKPMSCLAEGCENEAQQGMVQEALGEELFAKYEAHMLEKAIREMDDSMECPNENCQMVAYLTDSQRNLVECSYCNYSFCNLCKGTFHGVSRCKFRKEDEERIMKEWNEADEAGKEEMYKRYGEKNMKALEERFLNRGWLEENSKQCPKCLVYIEKDEGCNKMHCTKCNASFCWLCSKTLNNVDPYSHYSEKGSCNGRLFQGTWVDEEVDEFDWE
ncbi:RBR-type E3 ubiquitin transferase [Caenorhabditis elegans]|uniref:RBR-type E3 ubiquitin transferase n=1 Tax=Caenorhabditis elegans TaxID=6239 RepID=Q20871_CAEEL|nr:RBR-type E3 ubiquitin transferase [Caenorhabditis elegans]CCD63137.1 RBR-type E3 ubiquitin transferase [Caenorhabditis elegans]|eukprot:NP_498196.1 RBR-type E3 ubiquitin transferase [Caenorhabditis elegans]